MVAGRVRREISGGISTRVFCGENVMLSVVEVPANAKAATHSHPEEQRGLVLEGEGARST
ncbi:MAG: hypothetical protein QGF38_10330 [Rhodospirillales bacterium]|nr:hypothetical protein [Rhodospirillales bacterium]MDP7652084.1 hypothetical protein [Rhodospirillales bacterium]